MAAKNSAASKLPPRTALYLLIGTGALVLFVLLGIIPMQQSLLDMDKRMEQTKFLIEEQGILHPIFLKMQALARAGGATAPQVPEKKGLGQEAVSGLTDYLAQVVVSKGLEAQSVIPDPGSLSKGSKALAVSLHVRGSLEQLQSLLSELAMMPSFENVETLRVETGESRRDFTLKVWLAAE